LLNLLSTVKQLLSHQAIKPSSHQAIKPSSHQAIKPSSHQAIKPSYVSVASAGLEDPPVDPAEPLNPA